MKSRIARALAAVGAFVVLCAAAAAQNAFPITSIRGIAYIPMESLREAGFRCEWDPLLKNLTVTGAGGWARFHVGSEYVLDRGNFSKLSGKARFYKGDVFLPASAASVLESLTAGAAPPVREPVSAPAQAIVPVRITLPRKIVVDAGHGGHDSGALGPGGAMEKHVALDVAREVARQLEALGFEAVLTRDTDTFLSLERRAATANVTKADVFVSIHANASTTRSLRGFEVYSLSEEADDEAIAMRRAEMSAPFFRTADPRPANGLKTILWDLRQAENRRESICAAHCIADVAGGEALAATRRLRSAQFYVLKWTECPAVLVEIGYLSNPQDARLLRSPYYRKRMAKAIAQGLAAYRTMFQETEGFTK